jgi:hypothetical protein
MHDVSTLRRCLARTLCRMMRSTMQSSTEQPRSNLPALIFTVEDHCNVRTPSGDSRTDKSLLLLQSFIRSSLMRGCRTHESLIFYIDVSRKRALDIRIMTSLCIVVQSSTADPGTRMNACFQGIIGRRITLSTITGSYRVSDSSLSAIRRSRRSTPPRNPHGHLLRSHHVKKFNEM